MHNLCPVLYFVELLDADFFSWYTALWKEMHYVYRLKIKKSGKCLVWRRFIFENICLITDICITYLCIIVVTLTVTCISLQI